jgi:hypothetical protein
MFLIPIVQGSPRHVHLSWEDDPSSSVTVTWRTDSISASVVEWGYDESYGFFSSGLPGEIHHVQLKDLTPSTDYYYRCGDGSSWSEGYKFSTGPGDGSGRYCFAVVGDDRGGYSIRRSIGLDLLDSDAEFVIHTGDLVSEGRDQTQWNNWFDSYVELLPITPMMPALGNHEENAPQYFEQMALPGNENWYSFDYGNSHFVCLNTETGLMGDQMEWLEDDLANSNSTWKFVYFHRPMYSSGYHGSDLSVRGAWEAILVRHGVDIVFCGHNHIYERTDPIKLGEITDNTNGIVHVVTGGGGAGLHPLGLTMKPWTEIAVSEHHYVLMTIKGGHLQLQARLPDGTVFDHLDIQKEPLPDLLVKSLSIEPTYPVPGRVSNITAVIGNGGGAASVESIARFAIDGSTYLEVSLPALLTGESVKTGINWVPRNPGPLDVSVQADCYDVIDEGLGEGNNQLTVPTIASEPKPDLTIVDVSYAPAPPVPDQEVTVSLDIANIGSTSSGQFEVKTTIVDVLEYSEVIPDLIPGSRIEIEVPWTAMTGDWEIFVTIDVLNVVEEAREDNNADNFTIQVRDLFRMGPAYLPRGIVPGVSSVIFYNASGRPIDNGSRIVVVWGIDGWQRPPVQLASPSTLALSRNFHTEMVRLEDDLWTCKMPSSDEISTIDIRFSDLPVCPGIVDDNGGRDWQIYGVRWAEGRIKGFSEAVEDAHVAGVNVSDYFAILETAEGLLAAYDFVGLDALIGDLTDDIRRDESIVILERAKYEYENAFQEGIKVDRARIYLEAATLELERGNNEDASRLGLLVIDLVEKARTEIGEFPLALLALFALLSPFFHERRYES